MRPDFKGTPIDYAKSLKAQELKKVIADCKKGPYDEFTDRCRICFEHYLRKEYEQAAWWSKHAELAR